MTIIEDRYRTEAHVLTHERDDAINSLREAVTLLESHGDFSEGVKAFLRETYQEYVFLCICHGGSVCGDACQSRHHGGCGYAS